MSRGPLFRWSDDAVEYVAQRFPSCEILPPINMRSCLRTSQLLKTADGSTIPVLWILAEKVHGPWDPKEKDVFWKDRDPTNVCFENVGIAEKNPFATRTPSKYTAPAGTPEYFRARNADPEVRIARNAYQRKRYANTRAAVKKLSQLEAGAPSGPPTDTSPFEQDMQKRLEEILAQGTPGTSKPEGA